VYNKRYIRGISLVSVAFISISCLGQQVQQADLSSAPPALSGIATPSNVLPQAAAPPAAAGFQVEGVANIFGSLPRGSGPSLPASDSDGSAAIPITAALRGAIASKPEPARRGSVLRSLFGPRTDVGIFTVGNLNSTSFIRLNDASHGGQQVVSSNKSSLGGGAEYRWRWNDRNAFGLLYVQNPSDGKLWVSSSASASGASSQSYIWPLMRWDFSILATQSFRLKNLSPFLNEGPGVVVTNGYSNSGWSGGFAFVAGVGTDYQFSRRFSTRVGVTFLNTRGGCYDDPTCSETWGVVEDLRIGFVYKWGREGSGDIVH